ncbi:MAG: coenzyme F420-0:L-glutamate ligase [Acidimicrobiia bacterium]|nr:coenzyme F420-0:L-glutamate ligase [Acidimicrobiia bacterium]NNF70313.1 coenzyme F420-0:L-glutamate ligase [Acidimicrobiia bacterium]NNK92075.1 coenzyme F420-0:L-glutamate ligase [Acidimicrobiia bacterium]
MTITITPLCQIPEIEVGADIATEILATGFELLPGDVVVVTHKIVSKAEGRVRQVLDEDGYRRLIEDEAAEILRRRGPLVITRTEHGFICANAGIDRSNAADDTAILLPTDPDASAHGIRMKLEAALGFGLAVIITDTFGRPWRRGVVDVAIGVSGIDPIVDLRGTPDASGRIMEATEIAIVDEIAAAADLAMGKATGCPVGVVRGLAWETGSGRATDLIRPDAEDMFR